MRALIVSYNEPRTISQLLSNFQGQNAIVWDNSESTKARLEIELTCKQHSAIYLSCETNVGYGAAINRAIEASVINGALRDDELICVLNQDVEIVRWPTQGFQDRGRVLLIPRVLDSLGSDVRWGTHVPVIDLNLVGRKVPFLHYPTGAAMVLSAALLAEIGPFDERFFMYYEDLDWMRRAMRAGFEPVEYDAVTVTHLGSQSSGRSFAKERHVTASSIRFHRKRFGTLVGALSTIARCVRRLPLASRSAGMRRALATGVREGWSR
jgi:GT2 family glycosyltransferase